jgi:hypothetical protein
VGNRHGIEGIVKQTKTWEKSPSETDNGCTFEAAFNKRRNFCPSSCAIGCILLCQFCGANIFPIDFPAIYLILPVSVIFFISCAFHFSNRCKEHADVSYVLTALPTIC